MGSKEISPNVFWVGVKHHNRRLFDALIPLPHGTSYNAYLILGSKKTALIDTVNPGFENELLEKISEHIDAAKVDYVIMNHAEPDHANAAKEVLAVAKNAKLVVSAKGKEAAKMYFDIPEERIMVGVGHSRTQATGSEGCKSIRNLQNKNEEDTEAAS
jgi:flavorubredoxin